MQSQCGHMYTGRYAYLESRKCCVTDNMSGRKVGYGRYSPFVRHLQGGLLVVADLKNNLLTELFVTCFNFFFLTYFSIMQFFSRVHQPQRRPVCTWIQELYEMTGSYFTVTLSSILFLIGATLFSVY